MKGEAERDPICFTSGRAPAVSEPPAHEPQKTRERWFIPNAPGNARTSTIRPQTAYPLAADVPPNTLVSSAHANSYAACPFGSVIQFSRRCQYVSASWLDCPESTDADGLACNAAHCTPGSVAGGETSNSTGEPCFAPPAPPPPGPGGATAGDMVAVSVTETGAANSWLSVTVMVNTPAVA